MTGSVGHAFRMAASVTLLIGTTGCHLPRWPVDAPLTSGYGIRFFGIAPDIHRGVDLDVPTGTPVQAMASGQVRFAGVMSGFGNVVWLDHDGGLVSLYAHLSEISVRDAQDVTAGDVVGLSGATGSVTAPHLHFEVWRWGRPVDPIAILGGKPSS